MSKLRIVEDLRRFPGQAVVAFVLNVDCAVLDDPANWRTGPRSTARQMWSYLYGRDILDRDPDLIAMGSFGELVEVDDSYGTSWLIASHINAGGHVQQDAVVPDDQVVQALATCLLDVWPYYLCLEGAGPRQLFFVAICGGLIRHPKYEEALQAFTADISLRKLFPFSDDSIASPEVRRQAFQGNYSFIVGTENSNEWNFFLYVANIVFCAAMRCRLAGTAITYANLLEGLGNVFKELRALADGQPIDAPSLVAFTGAHLTEGEPISLGTAGFLRPAEDRDVGTFFRDSQSVATVFETTESVRIHSVQMRNPDQGETFDGPDVKASSAALRHRQNARSQSDLLRLAVLLASGEQILVMREAGRYVLDLVGMGGATAVEDDSRGRGTLDLDGETAARVALWFERISEGYRPELGIGVRRLLSAATSRSNATDSFVDAVICWESLFGVRTETNFRVTAAIAKLLEPDDMVQRQALHKDLKKIYSARSAIVHGAKEPEWEQVFDYRDRSIRVAMEAMRRLFSVRTDLLRMSSEDRASFVLLE